MLEVKDKTDVKRVYVRCKYGDEMQIKCWNFWFIIHINIIQKHVQFLVVF